MPRLLAIIAGAIAAMSLAVGAYLMVVPTSAEIHGSTPDSSAPVTGTGPLTAIGASLTATSCQPAYGDGLAVRQSAITITLGVTAPREAISFEL
jgi:hypothetical protein